MSPAGSSTNTATTTTGSPVEMLDPAPDGGAVDLDDSHDPRLLVPGNPIGLLAAARALVDNADLHDTLAVWHRRLLDLSWSGAAADAFHTHLTRQATRHTRAADATRTAARALTELADGIDEARTQAGRAALLHAEADPDHRTDRRSDPELRDQAHHLLADTRAALEDLHARVRTQLATAQAALPDAHRLLTDPEPSTDHYAAAARLALPVLTDLPAPHASDASATEPAATPPAAAAAVVGTVAAGVDPASATAIRPATASGAGVDMTTVPVTNGSALIGNSPRTQGTLGTEPRERRQTVVRPGDTLSAIAARELGDPTRWPEILDCNPTLDHPWQIQPGQHLTLPDNPTPADTDQPASDRSGSGHPPPPAPSPGPTAGPSPLGDAIHGQSSDAGGVGLDEGLFIAGGLAAALSVAYLLRQRRREHRFRPDTLNRDTLAEPTTHGDLDELGELGELDSLQDGDALRGKSGHRSAAPRRRGNGVAEPDDINIADASIHAALEPPSPGTRRRVVDRGGPVRRARRGGEPPMPPVVRRLHYAYHRNPPTGRPEPPLQGQVAGWAGPPLAPQPRRSAGLRDASEQVRAPLVVPLGLTPTGTGVYADLTLAPALALTNLPAHETPTGHETADQQRDRAEDVARALLLTIAAGLRTPLGDPLGQVVITSADLHRLLDLTEPLPRAIALPSTIRVVDDLDAALDDLEVTLAHRPPHLGPLSPPPAVVLIATAPHPGASTARIRRLLTAAHPHRLCAVLLGEWPTPARITVAPNATAAAVTGPLPPQLAGARLFTVPRHDALDLLAALARPTDPDHTPVSHPTPHDVAADPADPPEQDTKTDTAHRLPQHDGPDAAPTHAGDDASLDQARPVPTATPATPGLRLQVFGHVDLHSPSDGTDAPDAAGGTDHARAPGGQLSESDLALLVYLALHPGGVDDEHLAADLWSDPEHPLATNPNTAIAQLDAALTALIGHQTHPAVHALHTSEHGHHQLNPRLISTDYHDFTAALAARRAATTADQQAAADSALISLYHGALAPDLHADWTEAPRRHASRAAITATIELARYLDERGEPDQAVGVLQHGIAVIGPCNEALYAHLIRLHRDHNRPEAALRTFATLVTQLATIEATPSPDTTALIGLKL